MRKLFISRGERSESQENTRVGVKNALDSHLAVFYRLPLAQDISRYSPNEEFPHRLWLLDIDTYSRTPVTRTLQGNEKQFELAGNSSYRDKLQ